MEKRKSTTTTTLLLFIFFLRLGAHYRTTGNVGTEHEIGVAQIIRHESFHNPLSHSNDIALIKLLKPANLGVGIGLVCLPDMRYALPFDNLNKTCWITGWGTLSSSGSQPNTLMEAKIPLVSKQRCLTSHPGRIDDSMLCAGLDTGGVDTCQGDSGGPLVCEFNGTWFLEGVTSWGFGCAYAFKYGVYAKVRDLKAWLTNHIYQAIPPAVSPQNQLVSALGKYSKQFFITLSWKLKVSFCHHLANTFFFFFTGKSSMTLIKHAIVALSVLQLL